MTDKTLIHQLIDKVLDVHEKTRHYVSVELHDCIISVWVMEGGWDAQKSFSLYKSFGKEDNGRIRESMDYLVHLLEKAPAAAAAKRPETINSLSHP